jgi:hypothetical protein
MKSNPVTLHSNWWIRRGAVHNVVVILSIYPVAIQLSMLFKWQSTVLSTILPLFMCITKNNTCTMYINCCTCSQPKYAWNISCWTLSKQSEKIHTDGPACVWFKNSRQLPYRTFVTPTFMSIIIPMSINPSACHCLVAGRGVSPGPQVSSTKQNEWGKGIGA